MSALPLPAGENVRHRLLVVIDEERGRFAPRSLVGRRAAGGRRSCGSEGCQMPSNAPLAPAGATGSPPGSSGSGCRHSCVGSCTSSTWTSHEQDALRRTRSSAGSPRSPMGDVQPLPFRLVIK